jgi:hypothetical protein
MLEEAKLTDGTGVRTAPNIPCISIKRPFQNRFPTFAFNAKQKKKTETVNANRRIRASGTTARTGL